MRRNREWWESHAQKHALRWRGKNPSRAKKRPRSSTNLYLGGVLPNDAEGLCTDTTILALANGCGTVRSYARMKSDRNPRSVNTAFLDFDRATDATTFMETHQASLQRMGIFCKFAYLKNRKREREREGDKAMEPFPRTLNKV